MMQFISLILTRVAAARDDERGATMVEYGLLVALVSIAAVVTLGLLGVGLNGVFEDVLAELPGA